MTSMFYGVKYAAALDQLSRIKIGLALTGYRRQFLPDQNLGGREGRRSERYPPTLSLDSITPGIVTTST